MRHLLVPYGLSAGVAVLVALWAAAVHGRPAGGAALAGCAFFALGTGTVAIFRARPKALLSFLVLGGLYFLALASLRWVTGGAAGAPDVVGAALYGLVLTWLQRGHRGG